MAMTWVFRVLTAAGGVFLFETYREIKAQTTTLEEMRRDMAVKNTYYQMRLDDQDRTLRRHEVMLERLPKTPLRR